MYKRQREALDYYESYFDEAGEAEEASVIQKLGSPGKVAAIIKADLRENSDSAGTYTEKGYYDERTEEPGQVPGAVSYTHLDVYKRQIIDLVSSCLHPVPVKGFSTQGL